MGQALSDRPRQYSHGAYGGRANSENPIARSRRNLHANGTAIDRGSALKMNLRIAIVGYGKMGRAIERLAPEHGCEVIRIFRSAENENSQAISAEALSGIDVVTEFSNSLAAPQNLRRLIEAGIPVVIGTTGWFKEMPQIREIAQAKNSGVVWGPNFSVGLHHFRAT